jgi:tripartite-type tricarboxylate transporter receptor subunit TctC
VENRAGAGGLIGMQAAAASAPDGYTLATGGLGNNVIPPVTMKGLPIDIPKVLIPVAQVGEFANVLVLRADHPARSVDELVRGFKSMKAAPLYGSNGTGTSSHLTSELFGLRTGVKVSHVPYKGSTDALVGVANGDLDFCFMNVPPSLPLVAAGKIKVLATTSAYRIRQLPDTPTMQEQGMAGFDVTSWLGIYAPAGVAPELMKKLSNDIVDGLSGPEYQKRLVTAGFEPKFRRVDEFVEWNNAELKRWDEVAKAANISFNYGG